MTMLSWYDQWPAGQWTHVVGVALGAYALGCITTGYYLVRSRTGQDLRTLGSGTLGARNAGRVLGRMGFIITLLGDLLKGTVAVWAVAKFAPGSGLEGLALVAVVAGHIWPVQLRCHGGKGVATCLGALLMYDYQMLVVFACLFAGPFLFLRRTMLPGLIAFAAMPFAAIWLARHAGATPAVAALQSLAVSAASLFILLAHRRNLTDEISKILERRRLQARH